MKRLRMKEIVRLRITDEFVLFLPPVTKKSPPEFKETREYLLNKFKRIITSSFMNTTTAAQREAYFESELRARAVTREGQIGYEFHVKVISYPEREQMSIPGLPGSEINNLIDPDTGVA